MVSQSFRLIATICLQVDIGLSLWRLLLTVVSTTDKLYHLESWRYLRLSLAEISPVTVSHSVTAAAGNLERCCSAHQIESESPANICDLCKDQHQQWRRRRRNAKCADTICRRRNLVSFYVILHFVDVESACMSFFFYFCAAPSIHPSTSLLMNARLDLSKLSSCRPLHWWCHAIPSSGALVVFGSYCQSCDIFIYSRTRVAEY